jgi:aminoglycoside 2'-N-acetyltransferase I
MTELPEFARLRRVRTADLTEAEVDQIRRLLTLAFGSDEEERFVDEDWQHAIGGLHFVLDVAGEIVAHAAVVERRIDIDGVSLRTGYVEAVATHPDRQRQGLGSAVMRDVGSHIGEAFELGALGTGRHAFYERLGWRPWPGEAFVRTASGRVRTPNEEGFILVLSTPATPPLDPLAPISCDWRPGDVW